MNLIKQIYWRRISQSEIRNSAAAEKSESESEGGQKFLPRRVAKRLLRGLFPQPPFLPAPPERSVWRAKRGNQSGFCSKKVRASFSNWSGWWDLNPRPSAPKADALSHCATARMY